jgi:hypothetical protein
MRNGIHQERGDHGETTFRVCATHRSYDPQCSDCNRTIPEVIEQLLTLASTLAQAIYDEREAERAFYGLPFDKNRQRGDAILRGTVLMKAKEKCNTALEAAIRAGWQPHQGPADAGEGE